jgi:uncharacterized membrane protein YhaH (DUF805 family)
MNYYTDVLKKYAVFTGRARRKEYWMFVLCNLIVYVVLAILASILSAATNSSVFTVILYLYVLAILLPTIALGVRRLHDTGRSGWWMLIALVPFLGAITLFIFSVLDSQPGDNLYGPNPKGVGASPMTATPPVA